MAGAWQERCTLLVEIMARRWFLALAIVAATGGGCASEPPRFVYVVGGSAVSAYRADGKTGALTIVAGSPFVIPGDAYGGAAVAPSGRFLYVGHRSGVGAGAVGTISLFAIGDGGALKGGPAATYALDGPVRALATAPDGRFLYAAHAVAGAAEALSVFRVDAATGALSVAGQPVPAVRDVAVDPTGRFAFTLVGGDPRAGDDRVVLQPIDAASGALGAPVAEAPLPAEARGERLVLAGGRALYVLLRPRQVTHGEPQAGRFSWVGAVAGYTVDVGTSRLTPAADASMTVGSASYARTLAVSPSGRFLFVIDEETPPIELGSVWAYEIDPATAALTPMRGSPVRAGVRARAAALDASERFLYVASVGPAPRLPATIWAYAVDRERGTLVRVPGTPSATTPQPAAVVTAVRAP